MADQMKLAVHRLEAGAMVAAKIGNGLEVGRELAQQPDDFQVALALALQRARRADAMEIAIEIEPQQIAGMIGRRPGVREDGLGKAERKKIERGDEGIEETHRVIGRDEIF